MRRYPGVTVRFGGFRGPRCSTPTGSPGGVYSDLLQLGLYGNLWHMLPLATINTFGWKVAPTYALQSPQHIGSQNFPTFGSDKEGVTDPRGHKVRTPPTVQYVQFEAHLDTFPI